MIQTFQKIFFEKNVSLGNNEKEELIQNGIDNLKIGNIIQRKIDNDLYMIENQKKEKSILNKNEMIYYLTNITNLLISFPIKSIYNFDISIFDEYDYYVTISEKNNYNFYNTSFFYFFNIDDLNNIYLKNYNFTKNSYIKIFLGNDINISPIYFYKKLYVSNFYLGTLVYKISDFLILKNEEENLIIPSNLKNYIKFDYVCYDDLNKNNNYIVYNAKSTYILSPYN